MSRDKKELRKVMLKMRDALSLEQRDNDSGTICDMVFMHPAVLCAKKLLLFASFGSEVNTDVIAQRALSSGMEIYYPRVEDKDIHFYGADDISELKPGFKGIREPQTMRPWDENVKDCVVLVPGAAFDATGHRIGYGGGYYDRFLAAHQGLFSIGLCFGFQLTDGVPCEEHDQSVNDMICGYYPGEV